MLQLFIMSKYNYDNTLQYLNKNIEVSVVAGKMIIYDGVMSYSNQISLTLNTGDSLKSPNVKSQSKVVIPFQTILNITTSSKT